MDKTYYEDHAEKGLFRSQRLARPLNTERGHSPRHNNGGINIGAGCNTLTKGVTVTGFKLEPPKRHASSNMPKEVPCSWQQTLDSGRSCHTRLQLPGASRATARELIVGMG